MVERVQLLRSIILTLITECECNPDGTVNPNVCNTETGECLCKENWTGIKCDLAGISSNENHNSTRSETTIGWTGTLLHFFQN